MKTLSPFPIRFVMAVMILATAIAFPYRASARNKAASIWFFADEAGLDFRGNSVVFFPFGTSFFTEGSAVICDERGDLLFYTDGETIWNKQHEPLPNGKGLQGNSYAAQPAIIVPQPGSPQLYFVFTVSKSSSVAYSLVDITANEGAGAVRDKNIPLWSSAASKITAVQHQNGVDIWVIVAGAEDNSFRAYLVTPGGIDTTPVISICGRGHSQESFDRSGMLKVSPDGTRLALSVSDPGFFELFAFDAADGTVSRPTLLDGYEGAYGIEFSPDGGKLYGTVVNWAKKKIYQFDLNTSHVGASVQSIGTTEDDGRFHALQLGIDGRIYVVREHAAYLGVINYPRRSGAACEYIDDGVYLEGYLTNHGLPTFIQSFFTPPVLELSVHDAKACEGDGELIFPVSLSEAGRTDVAVEYRVYAGSATEGEDFLPASGTLTLKAGAVTGDIAVPLVDDAIFDEGDEDLRLALSHPQGAVLLKERGTGVIRENDLVEASISDSSAFEQDGEMRLTISLSVPSRSDVSVGYTLTDRTAAAGLDYLASPGSVTIPAGSSSADIRVGLLDNDFDEEDRAFDITLSNPSNAILARARGVGTILDDDAPPALVIDDAVMTEGTGTMEFTVRLSHASRLDAFMDYAAHDKSAHAGSDYSITSGTVRIPSGLTTGTILVDVLDDTLDEANEEFHVYLSEAKHATIRDNTALAVIRDNDPPPTLTVDDVTFDEDEGEITFIARLSAVSGRDVRIRWATRDGSARAGEDYEAVSGDLLIPAGSLFAAIHVPLRNDLRDELDETVYLCLREAAHARIAQPEAVGTIRDTDSPPSLSISDVSGTEDAGMLTFSVELSCPTYQDVTVRHATCDGSATLAGDDYCVIPDAVLRIPAGDTAAAISVRINDDSLAEGDETVAIMLYEPMNALLATPQGIGTIWDNDALPDLWIDDADACEGDGALTFTARLSHVSELPVLFSYRTLPGTAGSRDYIEDMGEMAIVPGSLSAPITVRIRDDALHEQDEHFALKLSHLSNARGIVTQAQGFIRENGDPY